MCKQDCNKIPMKKQRKLDTKTFLKKSRKMRRIILPAFNTFYAATAINAGCH